MKWEIRDETGCIHSGTEEEMRKAWDALTLTVEELMGTYDLNSSQAEMLQLEWKTDWEGDIELLQVHAIHR